MPSDFSERQGEKDIQTVRENRKRENTMKVFVCVCVRERERERERERIM